MNAIELLKKDHRTVESLFESFEKAKEKESETSKAELFASIKEELDAHARVEEEIFYPAFDRAAEKDDDKELVLEAGEEHKQVKTLLAELEGLGPDDETFDAKMKVLKDNVEHHVKEEEGEMFPHARKQLGDEQLEQLGERIAARKEQIQQQPADARSSAGRQQAGSARRARATSPGRRSGRGSEAGGGEGVRASDGSGSELLESMGMESKSEGSSRGTGSRRSSPSGASRSRGGSSRSKSASRSTGTSRSRSGSSRASGGRGRSSGSSSRSRSTSSRGRSTTSRGSSTSRRTSSSGRGRSRGRSRSART